VTASLYPAFAAGVLIVIARCTCIDNSELKEEQERLAALIAKDNAPNS
jgi:hypothetical protein